MTTLGNVWSVARWEATMVRRLARFWIFGVLALVLAVAQANVNALQVMFLSRLAASGTVATINPKFIFPGYIANFSIVIVLAATFLAFDFRIKERLARFGDVLHARPIRTGELVAGKVIGVFLPLWAVGVATILGIALSSELWGHGNHWGYLAFAGLFWLPGNLLFLITLTALVGVLFRSRALTALITIGLMVVIVLIIMGIISVPFTWMALADPLGLYQLPFPSEMIGLAPITLGVLHRIGFLGVTVAMAGFLTALYPRPRAGRTAVPLGVGVAGLVVAAVLVPAPLLDGLRILDDKRTILAEQHALADRAPIEVAHYAIDVTVDPGKSLGGRARMRVVNPGPEPVAEYVFTLNPGLEVEQVTDGAGRALDHERGRSTLVVTPERALDPLAETEVVVTYAGDIVEEASFLDAGFDLIDTDGSDRNIALLGLFNGIFENGAVALPPEVRWYPSANVDYRPGAGGRRHVFSTATIRLSAPRGMVPVTAGLPATDPSGTTYTTDVPMPGFALLVAPYEVVDGEVDGLPVRLYYHPTHRDNVAFFADAAERIREEIGARLRQARERTGLDYPFPTLAAVEVPIGLRSYGGGWEMASTQSQPGLVLLKENVFFEYPFERTYDHRVEQREEDGEQVDAAELKAELLEEFFRYDFSGGNVEVLASMQLWRHRIDGAGAIGAVLDRTFEANVQQLAFDRRGYFDPYIYTGDFNRQINLIAQRATSGARGQQPYDFTDSMIRIFTGSDEVWQLVQSAPLAELVPGDEPADYLRAVDLKGYAFVVALREQIGERAFAELLAALVERHGFAQYTVADVRAIAGEIAGRDLTDFFARWTESTALPGYRIVDTEGYRVETEDGLPRYQVLVRLQNGEEVPGFAKVSLLTERGGDGGRWDSVDRFVPLAGETEKEIGFVVSGKPRRVLVEPYLSRNRGRLSRDLEVAGEPRDVDPFEGVREAALTGPGAGVVVADDLDPGFAVEGGGARGALRIAARGDAEAGLGPCDSARQPSRWCRQEIDRAYGRYRHVATVKLPGDGAASAVWEAELPNGGRCSVAVHFPVVSGRLGWRAFGIRTAPEGALRYTVEHADGRDEVTLRLEGIGDGWNDLGRYRFEPGGRYSVRLSDDSDGLVVADAVRWSCAEPGS